MSPLLWIAVLMIAGGIIVASLEAWAKVKVASRPELVEVASPGEKLLDLLKSALTGPVANVLIVLGFLLILIDADLFALTLGGTGG